MRAPTGAVRRGRAIQAAWCGGAQRCVAPICRPEGARRPAHRQPRRAASAQQPARRARPRSARGQSARSGGACERSACSACPRAPHAPGDACARRWRALAGGTPRTLRAPASQGGGLTARGAGRAVRFCHLVPTTPRASRRVAPRGHTSPLPGSMKSVATALGRVFLSASRVTCAAVAPAPPRAFAAAPPLRPLRRGLCSLRLPPRSPLRVAMRASGGGFPGKRPADGGAGRSYSSGGDAKRARPAPDAVRLADAPGSRWAGLEQPERRSAPQKAQRPAPAAAPLQPKARPYRSMHPAALRCRCPHTPSAASAAWLAPWALPVGSTGLRRMRASRAVSMSHL